MGKNWQEQLCNAIEALLATENEAVVYFTRCDLLGEAVEPIHMIWELSESQKILNKQSTDGSWQGPVKKAPVYPEEHSRLVATFKNFRTLVERYRVTREHPPC